MQADTPNEKPKRNYIIATIVITVLLGLPLGSYWYLHSGLEYQKAALSELDSLGVLPALELPDQNSRRVDSSLTAGKVILASFFDLNDSKTGSRLNNMKAIHAQFDNRKDVLFFSFYTGEQSEAPEALAARLDIKDSDQWKLLYLPGAEFTNMLQAFALSNETRHNISLVDIRGTVRKAYDSDDNKAMGRLIEHTAMLIPARESRKAELRRQQEK